LSALITQKRQSSSFGKKNLTSSNSLNAIQFFSQSFIFPMQKKEFFFAPNNSAKMKFMLKGQRFGCVCVKSRPKSG
jgi:hypothetical protein